MQDVNTSYLLPHRYKRIGWGVIGIFFLLYVFFYLLTSIGIHTGILFWLEGLEFSVIMIGLTIVISSREEKEDEMIRLIRLKSFQYGLYARVLIEVVGMVLWLVGLNFPLIPIDAFGEINGVLILILIIYQFNLFRLRSDEE